eukprot:scaffold249393_cov32-Tisochrysis_lutea.AAC.7
MRECSSTKERECSPRCRIGVVNCQLPSPIPLLLRPKGRILSHVANARAGGSRRRKGRRVRLPRGERGLQRLRWFDSLPLVAWRGMYCGLVCQPLGLALLFVPGRVVVGARSASRTWCVRRWVRQSPAFPPRARFHDEL